MVGVRTLRDLETGKAGRPQRSTAELLARALGLGGEERAAFLSAARSGPGPRVHLRPVDDLVGRDAAVAEVGALVRAADLVTLVGLSGIGKASIALTVGHQYVEHFPRGVAGVSVTEASTESEVLASIVATFGAGRLESLPAVLAGGRALLVMLNADRNRDAARAALAVVRQRCPQLCVLVTGGHPLGLPGEHEWPVPPLEVPPASATAAEAFNYPATRLFLDRLRLVRPRPVGLDEAQTLATLVRRLGGVPLALELAAARGRVLELDEILTRCADVSGAADPAAQSLREAVLASWRWLSPAEQECVRWLGVFQWRWSIGMAEGLLAAGPATDIGGDVVALVDRLVGLGLAGVRPDRQEARFWLIDAVRRVALEQAAVAGVLVPARDRHAVVMAELIARTIAETPDAGGQGSPESTSGTDSILADLYAALEHLESDETGASVAHLAALRLDLKRWMDRRGL